MFLGTGTAGAYHAGVLRALLEAGVRVDLVAGRGIGAATAMFAAVDAGARLWEAAGAWRGRPGPRGMYPWRPVWRLLAATVLGATGLLALPLLLVAGLMLIYPALLVVALVAPAVGGAWVEHWRDAIAWVSGPVVLGSILPRLVTAVLVAMAAVVVGLYVAGRWRDGAPRTGRGAIWWRALGAPLDARHALDWALGAFWEFMRGAASIAQPGPDDLSRRYTELLAENLGQPGYRELILLAHDLDSRRDLVFALLAEPWRKPFVARAAAEPGELIDLAGASRRHVVDALAAALTPPLAAEPRPMAFSPESFWRGETHRLCDRPAGATRLLREVVAAGATQIIVVSAAPPVAAPHALSKPSFEPRSRIGEVLDAFEAAAVVDAVGTWRDRVSALYPIQLAHNPVGAFAFAGRNDERSDRHVRIDELIERGYEDAYRQFLEPVIGGSGEQIHGATVVGPTPLPENLPLRLTRDS